MRSRLLFWLAIALVIPFRAAGLDGVSVTAHWSGSYDQAFGGYGEIWRHDIVNNEVVARTLLYENPENPARNPVISPDGSRVAFLTRGGTIAVAPLSGGDVVVLDEAFAHGEACIDWPADNWIYYLKGGYDQPNGSTQIHRVDVLTGRDEHVMTMLREDGVSLSGTWRLHVASDLKRAVVRPDNRVPEPYGRIVALDLEEKTGRLTLARSTDRFSCSTGIDPDGEFFMDGHQDHKGVDIRRWDDLSLVSSAKWTDALLWGPDVRQAGTAHNRNAWAANSSDWLCIHIGWGNYQSVTGGNQMLINWREKQRVVVTDHPAQSFEYDSAGDLWVGSGGPRSDAIAPIVQRVRVAADGATVSLRFSEPMEVMTASDASAYTLTPAREIRGVVLSDDGRTVDIGVEPLVSGQQYSLRLTGLRDRAVVPNEVDPARSYAVVLAPPEEPLGVDAGPDATLSLDLGLYLDGRVFYAESGAAAEASVTWSVVSGPGPVTILDERRAETFVSFEQDGEYVLRLAADDGRSSAADEVVVIVSSLPTITIVAPQGGERFEAGATHYIEWVTSQVTDVRIDFSADGGETWQLVEFSVDTSSSNWGRYPWTVPSAPSERALLRLEEYSQVTSTVSQPFAIDAGQPILELAGPLGGETFAAGQEVTILWSGRDVHAALVEVSYDDGNLWEMLATVGSESERWGALKWQIPSVHSPYVKLRLRTPSGTLAVESNRFTVAAEAQMPSDLELGHITVRSGGLGRAGAVVAAEPGGRARTAKGSYVAELSVPSGVRTAVFGLQQELDGGVVERIMRIDAQIAEEPIPGFGVGVQELRRFLGGRGGVLVWTDSQGAIKSLDFTGAEAIQRTHLDVGTLSNPLLSPDGTRFSYTLGPFADAKEIRVHDRAGGRDKQVGYGDLGYWHVRQDGEYLVVCDWSAKVENGADGVTGVRKLAADGVTPEGPKITLFSRAMDGGPNGSLTWLGQVYSELWAYDVLNETEYPTEKFVLMDGTVADHQTCNGSMAPDETGRLMTLVIPHDWVRVFSYVSATDRFEETSRLNLPPGMIEWEFPEWSTDAGYFTAILRSQDLANHVVIAKIAEGDIVPELLVLGMDDPGVTYTHLYVAP